MQIAEKLQDEYPWVQAELIFSMGVTLRVSHLKFTPFYKYATYICTKHKVERMRGSMLSKECNVIHVRSKLLYILCIKKKMFF